MLYLGSNGLYFRSPDDCGYGEPEFIDGEPVIAQSGAEPEGVDNVKTLSYVTGLPDDVDLFSAYSYFFDHAVETEFEMAELLFKGVLLESELCHCIQIENTYAWFKFKDLTVIPLGSISFNERLTVFSTGMFIKRLNYEMADSGVNIFNVTFYGTDGFFGRRTYHNLSDIFWGCSMSDLFFLLSPQIRREYNLDAKDFVNLLRINVKSIGLRLYDKKLYTRHVYLKDISSCRSVVVHEKGSQFGLIVDCEGQLGGSGELTQGCRELGGLIWCKNADILVSVETFNCDNRLIEETLTQALKNLRGFSGGSKSLTILTFGMSDKVMLESSVNLGRLHKNIKFVDCRQFILKHVDCADGKLTLSNIARNLGVMAVKPKHKAVNDARTLLNVLSMILHKTGEFV